MGIFGQIFGVPQIAGASPLASAKMLVGNSSGIAAAVDLSGNVTVTNTGAATVGGVLGATSIAFGGGTALATYVEGSWTPTLVGTSTPGTGQTYSTQLGFYEQIGRVVYLRFTIVATGLGTAAGNLKIGGLPIANIAQNGMCAITQYSVSGLAALNYGMSGGVDQSASTISLFQNSSTASGSLTVTQAGSTPFFIGTATYRAS